MPPSEARVFLDAYTEEVLAWRLGSPDNQAQPAEDADQARRVAERALRMFAAGERARMVLLGLGNGRLAHLLCEGLPGGALLILEADVENAREIRPALKEMMEARGVAFLADTSPWSLLLLSRASGHTPENSTLCRNPALAGKGRETLLAWERLFTSSVPEKIPSAREPAPSLSVSCMLHPEEPNLEDFFAQMPPWLDEVCALWDGNAPKKIVCPAPLRTASRPLNAHFGEQRNAALALCCSEWCLQLDADERLEPRSWDALRRLLHVRGLGGVLFPRLTFEGDTEHTRMGYGLWPDMQLRLFRVMPGLHFEGAVHERIVGLSGRLGAAVDMPLLHYSRVCKNRESIERRLAVFNRAAGEERHRLSAGYPRMPLTVSRWTEDALAGHLLMLPAVNG